MPWCGNVITWPICVNTSTAVKRLSRLSNVYFASFWGLQLMAPFCCCLFKSCEPSFVWWRNYYSRKISGSSSRSCCQSSCCGKLTYSILSSIMLTSCSGWRFMWLATTVHVGLHFSKYSFCCSTNAWFGQNPVLVWYTWTLSYLHFFQNLWKKTFKLILNVIYYRLNEGLKPFQYWSGCMVRISVLLNVKSTRK